MKLEHSLTPCTKINSKWIKELNVKPDTFRGKHRQNTLWHKSQQYLFWSIFQINVNKNKINKWDLIKLKSFCTAKEIINKMKRQFTKWEKIFANYVTNKGLISKSHKQFIQLNNKKTKNPIQKWAEDLNRHFSKEEIQMANKIGRASCRERV